MIMHNNNNRKEPKMFEQTPFITQYYVRVMKIGTQKVKKKKIF